MVTLHSMPRNPLVLQKQHFVKVTLTLMVFIKSGTFSSCQRLLNQRCKPVLLDKLPVLGLID